MLANPKVRIVGLSDSYADFWRISGDMCVLKNKQSKSHNYLVGLKRKITMSTNPNKLLEEILSIYSRLTPIGNREARERAFHPVKYRLNNLREVMFTDYPGHSQYVDDFSYHSLRALATRPIDGNSPQRHQMFADRALTIIKRALNKR